MENCIIFSDNKRKASIASRKDKSCSLKQRSVFTLPFIQTSMSKSYWCRQLCSGTTTGCTLDFLLWETFLNKNEQMDRLQAVRQKAIQPYQARELQRAVVLHERKVLQTGSRSHTQTHIYACITLHSPPSCAPHYSSSLYLAFPCLPTSIILVPVLFLQ